MTRSTTLLMFLVVVLSAVFTVLTIADASTPLL